MRCVVKKSYLLILISFLFIGCRVETPIDVQNQTVNEQSFAYTQDEVVLFKSLSSVSIRPLIDNSSLYAFSVQPQLPAGLSINPVTGEISGTPSVKAAKNFYTIIAENSIKTVYSKLTIEVKDEPVLSLHYVQQSTTNIVNLVKGEQGVPITTIEPVTYGGSVDYYSIESSAGSGILAQIGLNFNSATGEISGTPSGFLSSNTDITIYAHNNGGSASTKLYLNITQKAPENLLFVNKAESQFTYTDGINTSIRVVNGIANQAITTINPVPTFPPVGELRYALDDTQKVAQFGLTFNGANGQISGIPTGFNGEIIKVIVTAYDDTLVVNNNLYDVGEEIQTAVLFFAIKQNEYTKLNYSSEDFVFKANQLNSLIPVFIGGEPSSYSIVPPLPTGLTLSAFAGGGNDKGEISGTPTQEYAQSSYLVTASNNGGDVTYGFNLKVADDPITSVNYGLIKFSGAATPDAVVLYKNENRDDEDNLINYIPTSTGGKPTEYLISPTLPAGLSFDSTTGIISSTTGPTETSPLVSYTLTAKNSLPQTQDYSFTLQIVEKAPVFSYSNVSIPINTAAPLIVPNLKSGSSPNSYLITSGTLPSGLSFDSFTGQISGTPTEPTTASGVNISIQGSNGAGAYIHTFTIVVTDNAPSGLFYSNENPVYKCKDPIITNFPTTTGGIVTSFNLIGSLPPGLTFTSGTIQGVPTEAGPPSNITVEASNASGSVFKTLKIQVKPEVPDFEYTSTTSYAGFPTTITPTLNHCAYGEQYFIDKNLPEGIVLDPLTGYVTINTANMIMRDKYKITAKNDWNYATSPAVAGQEAFSEVELSTDYLASSDFEVVFMGTGNFNDDFISDLIVIEKKCPFLCTAGKIKVFLGQGNTTTIVDEWGFPTTISIPNGSYKPSYELDLSTITNAPGYFDIDNIRLTNLNTTDILTDIVFVEKTTDKIFFLKNIKESSSSLNKFIYMGHTDAPPTVSDIKIANIDDDDASLNEVLVSDNSPNLSIYFYNSKTSSYDTRVIKNFYQIAGEPGVSEILGIRSIKDFEVLDLDGDPSTKELVVLDDQTKRICLIMGTGDQSGFEDSCTTVLTPDQQISSLRTSDINGDSAGDILMQMEDGNIYIYMNDAEGFSTYDPAASEPSTTRKSASVISSADSGFEIADINNDCVKDILILNKPENKIEIHRGNVDGDGEIFNFDVDVEDILYSGISSFFVSTPVTDSSYSSKAIITCSKNSGTCGIPFNSNFTAARQCY